MPMKWTRLRPVDNCTLKTPRKTLDELIRRIVEVAQPERIALYGSAARGDMTRNSDVDLLIIKDGGKRHETQGKTAP